MTPMWVSLVPRPDRFRYMKDFGGGLRLQNQVYDYRDRY